MGSNMEYKMSPKSTFSKEGDTNLLSTKKAANFTNWMYDEIKPYLRGNILELGSGIGTYSEKVVKDFNKNIVVLSDIDQEYIKNLQNKFQSYKNVFVKKIDISEPEDFSDFKCKINSVFALNVLEHIYDDVKALNNIYDSLEIGGNLVILVPAHKFLFNCIDKAIGHYRRYSKEEVISKVMQTKFKIEKMFYFNFAAIPGWYINGNILRKQVVSENVISLFNKFIPILKFIERYIIFHRFGISLIVVLTK
jgi:SAM-dependent methyltransferase